MISAPPTANEEARIEALLSYELLDTEFEDAYDRLTALASKVCHTPISLVSLVDKNRQWFKSCIGMNQTETKREIAFCAHAILHEDAMVVEDAQLDERFADNPLVTGEPHVRFYAGIPLVDPHGHALGTLCVMDTQAREIADEELDMLETIAEQVMNLFELRAAHNQLQKYTRHMQETIAKQDKFFYAVANDLRAPFNSINGFSNLLADRLDNVTHAEYSEMAKIIQRSANSATHMLDEILEWAACQHGKIDCQPIVIELDRVVDKLLEKLNPLAVKKSISLKQLGDRELKVYADRYMLHAILSHLLTNAIKFTHNGGTVGIHIGTKKKNIQIDVIDNGVGISSKKLNELFVSTIHNNTLGTDSESGIGFGLLIAKEYAEMNQGKLRVKSKEGKGSTFTLSLPSNIPAQ